jgi:uncharacterized protein YecT (DUF1311 family)
MFTALIALAAATGAPASVPSKEFVQACYERAKSQAELDFCSAGEAEAKKHDLEDAEAVACFDKELSQMGMNICAGQESERADKALNLAWAKAKDWVKDDAQAAKLLLESQRSWLKYRDAECELIADENRGGSIVPLEHGKCLTGLTKERTEALTNFAKPMDEQ